MTKPNKNKRKAISKRIRFEVFKRDKFTCQYCGSKAPDVILQVDHIEPVSKGGENTILNYVTSCFDCNSGKSNIQLSDNAVMAKQQAQMERLQERREQLRMMYEWREELGSMQLETENMAICYIENKIGGYKLSGTGLTKQKALAKKYDLADILETVDISADQYLKYDNDGNLTKESVEEFTSKIGGILRVKNRPPIEQKAAYIKGICRNRFGYWDQKIGSIILNNYIKALKNYGWSESQILSDLENEVQPRTIEANNWSQWKALIEDWTTSVKGWDQVDTEKERVEQDELDQVVKWILDHRLLVAPVLESLIKASDKPGEQEAQKYIDTALLKYLNDLVEYYESPTSKRQDNVPTYRTYIFHMISELFFCVESGDLGLYLGYAAEGIMENYFKEIGIPEACEYTSVDAGTYRHILNKIRDVMLPNKPHDTRH